ncbi:MAG: hemerythrin domain-containing protein, partial [Alphaproteobacteria bacterium]
MPATLERLQQEHRDVAKLLDILENELAAFDNAATPDFEIMAAIADYFLGYPATAHHPKEDLVYRILVERWPDRVNAVGDIEAEHGTIAELVRIFAQAVTNVMHDAEISREAFSHA